MATTDNPAAGTDPRGVLIHTAAELDALSWGSVVRFQEACAAAIRTPRGWSITGFDWPQDQCREALVSVLPVRALDVPPYIRPTVPGVPGEVLPKGHPDA